MEPPLFAHNLLCYNILVILLISIIFFLFGLIIGSFLNVVIYRLNTGRSLGGRSACLSCQKTLRAYELIPVFSFIGLWGRCRSCKNKISIQYPLVELATGLIFATLFLKFSDLFISNTLNFAATYVYYAAIFSLLTVIVVYDIRHKIIVDALSLTLAILAFIGLFFFNPSNFSGSISFYPHLPAVLDFLSGILVALPFALLWLVSGGKWMGLGDAKLSLGLGWLLGLPLAFSGLVLAFWLGAIVGIALIIFSRKYSIKSEIPFAPYLVFGAFLVFIFGLHIF